MNINDFKEVQAGNYRLIQGECLDVMNKLIADGVKVNAIITDPPY